MTGNMTVSGAVDGWQTLTSTIPISAGIHVLKLEMISGDAQGVGLFDCITIYKDPISISNPTTQYPTNLLEETSLADAKTNGLCKEYQPRGSGELIQMGVTSNVT